MSTIGHPLSDLSNLLTAYSLANSQTALRIGRGNKAFQEGATPGLPTKGECIAWYREAAGWDPSPDITWGDAFGLFRGAIIMQGIAARYAQRQASSAKALEYAVQMKPYGHVCWEFVQEINKQNKAKL